MGGLMRACSLGMLVLLGAGGCKGREKAAGSDNGPYGDRVAAAIPKIEAATGLRFKTPPRVESRSKEQVRAFLEKSFTASRAAKELTGMETAYKLFGFLPDTLDLHKLLVDLLTEQIVGYYDPHAKVLYVVSDASEDFVGVTITHELVHALQDQYINLDSIQQVASDNDHTSAAQAVIEGEAVFEQMSIMMGNNLAAGLPGGWDKVREMIREQSSSMPRFAMSPLIVQETVIFPYLAGAEYVRAAKAARPGQAPILDMPVSTEQVLHPEKKLSDKPDVPSAISLGSPRNGTLVYENTLGEFETKLFLYEHLRDDAGAVRGASGWDGDRYQVVKTAAGNAIAWVTTWDNAIEAGEFYDLMDHVIQRRFQPKEFTRLPDGKGYDEKHRSIALRTATIQGRPTVIYIDVPKGASTDLLDLGHIEIHQ